MDIIIPCKNVIGAFMIYSFSGAMNTVSYFSIDSPLDSTSIKLVLYVLVIELTGISTKNTDSLISS